MPKNGSLIRSKSAIAQTWSHREIIVVDDGSIDRTLAIARQFASEGITIFTQENRGAAAARNTALGLSRGDYIQWLDADDLLAPDKIAKQVGGAWGRGRGTEANTALGGMGAVHTDPTARSLLQLSYGAISIRLNGCRKMAHNLHMQTATWLVSRELTDAAGP